MGPLPRPDSIFTCVGKGSNGAITELRHGLEARIGLFMDYEQPITQAWPLSSLSFSYDGESSHFLLSFVESSVVIRMSSDEASIEVVDSEDLGLDLIHRTIEVLSQGVVTIQVTEQSIVIIDGVHRYVNTSQHHESPTNTTVVISMILTNY